MRGLGHTSCRPFAVILSEAKTTRIWLMYKFRDPALRSMTRIENSSTRSEPFRKLQPPSRQFVTQTLKPAALCLRVGSRRWFTTCASKLTLETRRQATALQTALLFVSGHGERLGLRNARIGRLYSPPGPYQEDSGKGD